MKQAMHGLEGGHCGWIRQLQQHQSGRDLRPVEPWQPVRARLEMRPEQFPALLKWGHCVIVERAGADQYPVARAGDEVAACMTETADARNRVDQKPVADAMRAKGA